MSDRVSCFDVVVGTIPPQGGQVLEPDGCVLVRAHPRDRAEPSRRRARSRVSIVRECRTLPVEFVMRGYLTGSSSTSIWTAYERGVRRYCGHDLPDGMRRHGSSPPRSSRRPRRPSTARTTS
ncbi:MAG: phosphoribosylaminoimidazolesuccinocarboxamide synthase [Myxococcota bacterium]